MNANQNELHEHGYVRVDGLTAILFGKESIVFSIPLPTDFPGKKFLDGPDFIFIFEIESNTTWYKKIDLVDDFIGQRSYLFMVLDIFQCATENEGDLKYGIPLKSTAFCLDFSIDPEGYAMRKLRPEAPISVPPYTISCEVALMQISGDLTNRVDSFIQFLLACDDLQLKPVPNPEFDLAFNSTANASNPVLLNERRHFYILVVLTAARRRVFPYKLEIEQFEAIVCL